MNKLQVLIIIGSDSDLLIMKEAAEILQEFKVNYKLIILSAHRTPEETVKYAKKAYAEGVKVIIAGAGGAAHLPGVIAALFPLPVIGVPIKTSTLNGVDSLYSIVQMPKGVPVACVGINAAKNAGILAFKILAINNNKLQKMLIDYKSKLTKTVLQKSDKLNKLGINKYLELLKK